MLTRALHVVVLLNFAVAYPIYDLLGRHPAFFVANRLRLADVVLLVVVLGGALPVAFAALGALAARLGRGVGEAAHLLLVLLATAVTALPPLNRTGWLAGWTPVLVAGGLAAAFTVAYGRWAVVRSWLAVLSPSVVVMPLVFLFHHPVLESVSGGGAPVAAVPLAARPPIVMVVLDGLSTASLLDGDRRIDRHRFPALASLAADALWFRNATTVADGTIQAVPAILTGRRPTTQPVPSPTSSGYPENLFTLLAGSYRLHVFEGVTRLCPPAVCGAWGAPLRGPASFFADVVVVYLHLVVPPGGTSSLPRISQGWGSFVPGPAGEAVPGAGDVEPWAPGKWMEHAVARLREDRAGTVDAFLATLDGLGPGSFHFVHVLLPHVPYVFLPSGRTYGSATTPPLRGLAADETWGPGPDDAARAGQRHLLQAMYVDRRLGELIEGLKARELFEDTLLVVVADHGASFRPGLPRRAYSEQTAGDIAWVPLLVKLPGARGGATSDASVQTIDLLPTLVDVLGAEVDWRLDGTSLLAAGGASAATRRISSFNGTVHELPAGDQALAEASRRHLELFGTGQDPLRLFRVGANGPLVGEATVELDATAETSFALEVENERWLDELPADSPFWPAYLRGTLVSASAPPGPRTLALALNGTVGAVTEAEELDRGVWRFEALVPEDLLLPGANRLEVLVAEPAAGGALRFGRAERRSRPVPVKLSSRSEQGTLVDRVELSDGSLVSLDLHAFNGYVEGVRAEEEKGLVSVSGWAADLANRRPVAGVAVFQGDRLIGRGLPTEDRPAVAEFLRSRAFLRSGFEVVADARKDGVELGELRVLPFSADGRVGELGFTEEVARDVVPPIATRIAAAPPDGRLPERGFVDQARIVAAEQRIEIVGWAPFLRSGSDQVLVLHTRLPVASVNLGRLYRPDIARASGRALGWSGFKITLRFAPDATPDHLELCLSARSASGERFRVVASKTGMVCPPIR